jgi:phosphoenolpyruvate carboxykinase (ATP)
MLHPNEYANVLSKKMDAAKSQVFLVNTGWNGKGDRISLTNTRLIIDAILNNELDNVPTQTVPIFNLEVPLNVNKVPSEILDPRNSWESNEKWDIKAKELAQLFINNFEKFCDNAKGQKLLVSGPQI